MTFQIKRPAELRADGMKRQQIDALPRVEGMTGVRLVGEPPADPRLIRIRAALEKAPSGAVLCGWAAAVLHGVPAEFLDGTLDGTRLAPVDLSVPDNAGSYDTGGLRPRRSRVPAVHRTEVDGALVTSPERTALDLARWAPFEARRLAMLDLSFRFGLIAPESFGEFLDPLGGLHRIGRVRDLVPLMSEHAESLPESEMRYHWVRVGLPAPLVNQPIHDRFGQFVGRPDLFEEESGLAGEYQGYVHLLDKAPEHDRARFERFGAMNMTVVDIWKSDGGQVGDKLLEGYAIATARDPRLDSWVCR